MPRIYRVMSRDGNLPKIAQTARGLGVRELGEILGEMRDPTKETPDIEAIDGQVSPGSGGMSVAPTWRELPKHRIPSRLAAEGKVAKARGRDTDACWTMGAGPFEPGQLTPQLVLRVTEPWHGVVEPSESTTLRGFREDLAATQPLWHVDED